MHKEVFSDFDGVFSRLCVLYKSSPAAAFVFPSEVVRRFFLDCMTDVYTAVDAGRFLSWDDFLRSYVADALHRPAGNMERILFASMVAPLCRRDGELEGLFDCPEDESPFVNYIASILPDVLIAPHVLAGFDRLPEKRAQAVRLLGAYYERFLSEAMLFEPEKAFLDARLDGRLPGNVVVVYPSLFTIRAFYKDELPDGWIGLDLVRKDVELTVFPDPVSEVRYVLSSLRNQLEKGAFAADFSIVLADRALEGILRTESEVYGVPLSFEFGRSLRDVPGVRLVFLISDAVSSGFSFESLRDLCLASDVPWRFSGTMREIIRLAVKSSYFSADYGENRLFSYIKYEVEHHLDDTFFSVLDERFDRGVLDVSFLEAYKDTEERFFAELGFIAWVLFSFLPAVVSSESFSMLVDRFSLLYDFLLGGEPGAEMRRSWGFARRALQRLCNYEVVLDGLFSVSRPWDVWLAVLSGMSYVSSESSGGVSVFPYRLSAGIAFKNTFVMGLDAESASVRTSLLSFLPEPEKESASIREYELGNAFLQAYSACNAFFSMHVEGGGRQHEVPPYVIIYGKTNAVEQDELEKLPIYGEKGLFAGETGNFLPFYSQKKGYDAALHLDHYFFKESFNPGDFFEIKPWFESKNYFSDGVFVFSPHFVQDFYDCPFRMFVSRLLDIDEYRIRPIFYDRMIVGSALHEVLSYFFSAGKRLDELANEGFDFKSVLLQGLNKRGAGFFSDVLSKRYEPYLNTIAERLRDSLENIGLSLYVKSQESELKWDNPEAGFILRGRMDLLLGDNDDSTIVIDFKTGNIPSFPKKEKLERGEKIDLQVLLYMLILYHLYGEDVSKLLDGMYFPVVNENKNNPLLLRNRKSSAGSYQDDSSLLDVFNILEELLEGIVDSLQVCDFTYAIDNENVCSSFTGACAYRRLCRARYAIREGRNNEN
ncbi:PD-(D/E)XK nuclease family protein [Spirochaetia bacterium 38H-sp]|uniref:PD-(D/E)XK nuclease family protein n=1 Tax=Rarispira pelagica TaxID=3141764 RepID=A0ABU9U8N8_9SPIR